MIIALAGPSGVGKSTLADGLLRRCPKLALSISHTTRKPRGTEQDGVHYYFIGSEQFQQMVDRDAFAEYADVFAHRYGTAKATLRRLERGGRDALLDIDYQGVSQLVRNLPTVVSILLVPPSLEVLRQRLSDRRTDSPEQLELRISKARLELSQYPLFKYVVVNDTIDQAVERLVSIYRAEQLLVSRNEELLSALLRSDAR